MGAVYGILGEASRDELEAMGARLAHRGTAGAHWSPAPGVHLGMRGTSRPVQSLADGPLVFDGALDNRRQLAERLGRPRSSTPSPADDGLLLLELLHLLGPDGLDLVAETASDYKRSIVLRDPDGILVEFLVAGAPLSELPDNAPSAADRFGV